MKGTFSRAVLLLAGLFAAGAALSTPVFIKETGLANGMATGGLLLPIYPRPLNFWAGLQTLTINDTREVLAFCVDPWEWSSSTNQAYTTNNLYTIFGRAKAGFISELYSESYGSTLQAGAAGNINAAAFQLALWEIITDENPNMTGLQSSFADGLVQKTGSTDTSIVQTATAMLGRIDGVYGHERYGFALYTSGKSLGRGKRGGYQDFLVANRIPEPGAFSLMLGALGGMGLLGWRLRVMAGDTRAKR